MIRIKKKIKNGLNVLISFKNIGYDLIGKASWRCTYPIPCDIHILWLGYIQLERNQLQIACNLKHPNADLTLVVLKYVKLDCCINNIGAKTTYIKSVITTKLNQQLNLKIHKDEAPVVLFYTL